MVNRYEISDAAWDLVAALFTQTRQTGRPRINDRLMLNGVLWLLCSGAACEIYLSVLAHGQRSITGFATGAIKAYLTRC